MAKPKVEVELTADAKGLKKGMAEAEKAVEKVDDAGEKLGKGRFSAGLEKLGAGINKFGGQAGSIAKDKLGPLGDIAEDVGFDLEKLGSGGLVAGAAVAGMGAFIAGGVQKLGQMTAEIRKFHDVSGATWEDSSRLVAVSDDFGIAADTAAASVGRLAKNIDAGKLKEFGIEVVEARDGTVDMAGTLGNVADKMNATIDPTKKAAMGTALFGKSWADLQPLLQQGGAGIREAMAAVKDYQIQTEKGAAEQREMEMALDDVQDAFAGLQMAAAKGALPTITKGLADLSEQLNELNDADEKIHLITGAFEAFGLLSNPFGKGDEIFGHLTESSDDAARSTAELAKQLAEAGVQGVEANKAAIDLATAEQEAANKADILKAHQKDATDQAKFLADAVKDQKAQLDLLNGTVLTIAGTQIAYDRSVINTDRSLGALAEKQQAATDAVALHGDGTKEAMDAEMDYSTAVLDAQGAAVDQANAEVGLAEKLAISAGQTFTAEQKSIVYKEALEKVRDASTDPNFVAGMDNLIGQTGNAAAAAGNAAANFYAMEAAASRAAAVASGAISVGSSGNTTSADAAERRLANQSLGGGGFSTQRGPLVVQLNQDGRRTAQVVLPWMVQEERSRR